MAVVVWTAGVLVVDARRIDRGDGAGRPPPLPEDGSVVNGGGIHGDRSQTNTPPGETH